MTLRFPSREFDDLVAAVCHDSASIEQVKALNVLLRNNPDARDEYILQLELHARLASEPDLFVSAAESAFTSQSPSHSGFSPRQDISPSQVGRPTRNKRLTWAIALAACAALLVTVLWSLWYFKTAGKNSETSKAIAMLNSTVDARWKTGREVPRLGAPLEPGWLRLESGLAQIIFYNGARVAMEGPAELQLISRNEASCQRGRIMAEVPPQASGFRVTTPQAKVTDLGTSFGLDVKESRTELHVFKGSVELRPGTSRSGQDLQEGSGALIEGTRAPRSITANPAAFATLFDLQARSAAAEAKRYNEWRAASERLNGDPSLLVRFDFQNSAPSLWQLQNTCSQRAASPDATIVGCRSVTGRWTQKQALEFQSVSDRVRFSVPDEYESLTLAAWVRVQGLDRYLNSLAMSDGFDPGTIHWLIRRDGVLGLTVIGTGKHQIVASPPVLTLDKFGMWIHLAVVLDGKANRVVHYVNGLPVSQTALNVQPPFRIGTAELGNWNARGFPKDEAFMIRNFSGAMDEFCLFSRALDAEDIQSLHAQGKPQGDTLAAN